MMRCSLPAVSAIQKVQRADGECYSTSASASVLTLGTLGTGDGLPYKATSELGLSSD